MKKYMILAAGVLVAAAANAQQSVTVQSKTSAEVQTGRRQATVSAQQNSAAETNAGKANATGETQAAISAKKTPKQQTEGAAQDAQQPLSTKATTVANVAGFAQQSLATQTSAITDVAGSAVLEPKPAPAPVKPLRPIVVQTGVTNTLKAVVAPVRVSHSLMGAAGLRLH
ncbi:hypothetical protein ACWKWU_00420 [Chitinophaga lutea]